LSPEVLKNIVQQVLGREPNIIKGWFKDTIAAMPANKKFSFVHIDGDLYESAIDVLDGLFLRRNISNGAIIFFDDWNCNEGSPKFGERRAWQQVVGKYQVQFSDLGSYSWAGQRFIVHEYDSFV